MKRITKADIIKNKYNIFLCLMYSTALAIVYCVWFRSLYDNLFITIMLATMFIIGGFVSAYLWTIHLSNQETNKE